MWRKYYFTEREKEKAENELQYVPLNFDDLSAAQKLAWNFVTPQRLLVYLHSQIGRDRDRPGKRKRREEGEEEEEEVWSNPTYDATNNNNNINEAVIKIKNSIAHSSIKNIVNANIALWKLQLRQLPINFPHHLMPPNPRSNEIKTFLKNYSKSNKTTERNNFKDKGQGSYFLLVYSFFY